MASILINKNDLPILIENYSKENNTFRLISVFQIKGNNNAFTYKFILNGKSAQINIYYKEKETKIIPFGRNVEASKILIEYIKSHSLNPNIETKQIVFPSKDLLCEQMKNYFTVFYSDRVKIEQTGNQYTFIGYNQDRVYIHQYKSKVMIQGKPLSVFGLIISYIAENTDIEIENFSNTLCESLNLNLPFSVVREKMQILLGRAYGYIDEAIRKTLSSSIVMLEKHKNDFLEDYSGCVTGAFKTLEGYLKKVLKKKYGHKFNRNATFEMFDTYNWSLKPGFINCETNEEKQLCALYKLFNNKRNVYLHAKIDPSMTSIISSYMDAESIFKEIVEAIKNSYEVFFGE